MAFTPVGAIIPLYMISIPFWYRSVIGVTRGDSVKSIALWFIQTQLSFTGGRLKVRLIYADDTCYPSRNYIHR